MDCVILTPSVPTCLGRTDVTVSRVTRAMASVVKVNNNAIVYPIDETHY